MVQKPNIHCTERGGIEFQVVGALIRVLCHQDKSGQAKHCLRGKRNSAEAGARGPRHMQVCKCAPVFRDTNRRGG